MIDNTELNVNKTLEYCQSKLEPFVFWDVKEFDKIKGYPFPNIGDNRPIGWKPHGRSLYVNLLKPEETPLVRGYLRNLVVEFSTLKEEIGFAIITRDGNGVTIQPFVSI